MNGIAQHLGWDESRTPPGVRGLKFNAMGVKSLSAASHPTRGAWIEMLIPVISKTVLPSRTPPGVRGLKYYTTALFVNNNCVAPHPGCVD